MFLRRLGNQRCCASDARRDAAPWRPGEITHKLAPPDDTIEAMWLRARREARDGLDALGWFPITGTPASWKEVVVAWLTLLGAGLLEIVWAFAINQSEGFTRLWSTVATVIAISASVGLLSWSAAIAADRHRLHGLDWDWICRNLRRRDHPPRRAGSSITCYRCSLDRGRPTAHEGIDSNVAMQDLHDAASNGADGLSRPDCPELRLPMADRSGLP